MFQSLLQEFENVFQDEVPKGLPLIRDIEHKITGAIIPNRLAYRENPTETKEIQRQVGELMEKGYTREFESMFCTSLIDAKERWNVAHVRGFLSHQQNHCKVSTSYS